MHVITALFSPKAVGEHASIRTTTLGLVKLSRIAGAKHNLVSKLDQPESERLTNNAVPYNADVHFALFSFLLKLAAMEKLRG